jgi:hypothetical protein
MEWEPVSIAPHWSDWQWIAPGRPFDPTCLDRGLRNRINCTRWVSDQVFLPCALWRDGACATGNTFPRRFAGDFTAHAVGHRIALQSWHRTAGLRPWLQLYWFGEIARALRET